MDFKNVLNFIESEVCKIQSLFLKNFTSIIFYSLEITSSHSQSPCDHLESITIRVFKTENRICNVIMNLISNTFLHTFSLKIVRMPIRRFPIN